MPHVISNTCTNCGKCESVCPTNAIYPKGMEWMLRDSFKFQDKEKFKLYNGNEIPVRKLQPPIEDDRYFIVPEKCTDCISEEEPQCVKVCPESCCIDIDLEYHIVNNIQEDESVQINQSLIPETTITTAYQEDRKDFYFSYDKNDKQYYSLIRKYLYSFVNTILNGERTEEDLCLEKANEKGDLSNILRRTKVVILLISNEYLKKKELLEKIASAIKDSNDELIVRYILINDVIINELENRGIKPISKIDSMSQPLSIYFPLETSKDDPLIFSDYYEEDKFVTICREIIKLYK